MSRRISRKMSMASRQSKVYSDRSAPIDPTLHKIFNFGVSDADLRYYTLKPVISSNQTTSATRSQSRNSGS